MLFLSTFSLRRPLPLALALVFAAPVSAQASSLYVDAAQADCSDGRSAAQNTATTPWCSLAPAAGKTQPGDVVRVAPGVYRGSFRPLVSGTRELPIRVLASAPGAVLDAAGAANALKLIAVAGWSFEGITITGGVNQGVWAEATRDVTLRDVTVTANPGAGVQLKGAAATTVTDSTISANGSAGVLELAGSTGSRISANRITGNGRGHSLYNGDGIQLGGSGAVVSGNTITGNGDAGLYEHGIYAGAASTGWTIERNTISGSGAANIKASGSGSVRYNRLVDGTYGLVLAANPAPVDVFENVITGRAQHLVFLTTGARARLYHDTIVQSGRSAASGEASAVFVNEAVSLEVRNTLACYDGPDDLGVALWINNASRAGTFTADTNWLCSRDARGRHTAYNGSRVDAATWRQSSHADARSVLSAPPTFDPDARALTPLHGAGIGDPLSLVTSDFAGVPWTATRDAGAYRMD